MQQTENKRAGRPKGSQNKTIRLRPEDFTKLTTALLELHQVPDRLDKLEAILSNKTDTQQSLPERLTPTNKL
jgi:hypothetical protein